MKHNAGLAQLAEQLTSNLQVAGSKPALGAIFSTALLSLALTFPGAATAKQSHPPEKASAQASKAKPKKAASTPAKAKQAEKPSSSKTKSTKSRTEASTSSKKPQKGRKPEAVENEHSSKKSRGSGAKGSQSLQKRAAVESAEPAEPKRTVVLQKAEAPTRTEHGCSGENGTLTAVGQVMKSGNKTFRCQKTWDFNEGKLVGYPAWVELFMPHPGWGAGLRETPRPPADAVVPVPGAKAKVAPLADTQTAEPEEDESAPSSVTNQLY